MKTNEITRIKMNDKQLRTLLLNEVAEIKANQIVIQSALIAILCKDSDEVESDTKRAMEKMNDNIESAKNDVVLRFMNRYGLEFDDTSENNSADNGDVQRIDVDKLLLSDIEKIDFTLLSNEEIEAVNKKVNEIFIGVFTARMKRFVSENNLNALSQKKSE